MPFSRGFIFFFDVYALLRAMRVMPPRDAEARAARRCRFITRYSAVLRASARRCCSASARRDSAERSFSPRALLLMLVFRRRSAARRRQIRFDMPPSAPSLALPLAIPDFQFAIFDISRFHY